MKKKLDFWRHKLLDLGKRNRMIHFRETTRSTLKLTEPSFEELYETIAVKEESLTFKRPIDRDTDVRIYSLLSLLDNLSSPLEVLIGDIRTSKSTYTDCLRTLRNMRSKTRLAIEEQGTNILYLCFGFIEWKEGRGASAQWIKSPLILVPAVLSIDGLNAPYKLSKHEDDIVLNPTLEYYLKAEYGIELPAFDSDKDTLDGYLGRLEEIADSRGWRILKEVSLGLLSFQKITMYNDLLKNEARIMENPVIRALTGDYAEVNDLSEELRDLDPDTVPSKECFQVLSADSSQQEAILLSKKNVSFVMQGPPGTGKSQTITNIIAEALADGKKVLFVSEKMAALQVVYRRLSDVHLADFCLPLHSYKANKKDILEQLGANLNEVKQTRVRDEAMNELDQLSEIRKELNSYAGDIHKPTSALNVSCYEVYGMIGKLKDVPTVITSFEDPLSVSTSELQAYVNAVREYGLSVKRLGSSAADTPWKGLSVRTAGYEYTEKMRSELETLNRELSEIADAVAAVPHCNDLINSLTYEDVCDLADSLLAVGGIKAIPEIDIGNIDIPQTVSTLKAMKRAYEDLALLRASVENVFAESIHSQPYKEWQDDIERALRGINRTSLLREEGAEYYFDRSEQIKSELTALREMLDGLDLTFTEINEILGTDYMANTPGMLKLRELYEAMDGNVILREDWFSDGQSRINSLAHEAKSNAEKMNDIKKQLLGKWDRSILSLRYAPILSRYRTEYTNTINKVLNPQYRKDKRQLYSLLLDGVYSISDDEIVETLELLSEYDEKKLWFTRRNKELEEAFGAFYIGIESDWNHLANATDTAKKIVEVTNGKVPGKLKELLCKYNYYQIIDLGGLVSQAEEKLGKAKEIIEKTGISFEIDDPSFNAFRSAAKICTLLSRLEVICVRIRCIKQHLADKSVQVDEMLECLNDLEEYIKAKSFISSHESEYKEQLGALYEGERTDWNGIISQLEGATALRESPIYDLIVGTVNATPYEKRKMKRISEQLSDCIDRSVMSFEWLCGCFSGEARLRRMTLGELCKKISGCCASIDSLGNYIDYCEAKDACAKKGLSAFIRKVEEGSVSDDLEKVFTKSFYYSWLGSLNDNVDSIRRFRKNTQNERVRRFVKLDSKQLAIAQMRIREKLIKELPTPARVIRATDEVSILNKELAKKRNIMPLRKLFGQIPNLLMKLKPCLMMSPLSVSYFLETDAYHFDMVIFDEASQIFPEDAIGAIFRGSQVIIAGDSKQLPPTNFFAASANNLDGDYDFADDDGYGEPVSDSILEEAANVLPNKTLRWHYRSKHESLIAFSNREIYKNSLITFPNNTNTVPDMGVEYVYVEDGIYEGGGKNCNQKEAERCVELVREHIQNYPSRSLGIIAFSEKQQEAIENAIIEFRESCPEFEWFFGEGRDEPFFIKNLENVQGDERDTIIFSICYAKDINGKMYMRFGPLGHAGGERRLNVAITRAKMNVKLVGSIKPSDIDLSRTDSEGVRMLRSYIEFARRGELGASLFAKRDSIESVDDFCDLICRCLTEHGYNIRRNVGYSDYKIDIAIENPNVEGDYVAGIECDGLSYVKAKTARDRDHLRTKILENMGWRMYRVWSTEWIRNPQAEQEALIAFIDDALKNRGCIKESGEAKKPDVNIADIAVETEKVVDPEAEKNPYNLEYYKVSQLLHDRHSNTASDRGKIVENILHILSTEQPLHMDLLYRRLAPAFPGGRVTEAVRNAVSSILSNELNGRVWVEREQFARLLPIAPIKVRIPSDEATQRHIEHIHTEELAMAMLHIAKYSFGIGEEDLYVECTRLFGFERVSTKTRPRLKTAVNYLLKRQKIRIIDGKIQYTDKQ